MAETSPAGELRQAAQLLRDRAESASVLWPGPWAVVEDGTPRVPWVMSPEGGVIAPAYLVVCEHVAGLHPGVALAVADWLDAIAWMIETDPDLIGRFGVDQAFATARAYLGTEGSGDDG